MISAQKIGRVVEQVYSGTSLTMAVQDGPEAGQSVPHVHMHVIPRRKKDWKNNDDIYDALDSSHSVDSPHRQERTEQDMQKEAETLTAYFMP
ncbi:HIT-like domain-containing protein [Spinellus fusiger]|nr:HIT-like domain-containing protein [Spinellus fusiger]